LNGANNRGFLLGALLNVFPKIGSLKEMGGSLKLGGDFLRGGPFRGFGGSI